MKTELEVKILNINKEEIIKKLESIGAKKVGEYFQRRLIYTFDKNNTSSWIRLRTNGKKHTLTIKERASETISGVKELEIEVSSFEETNKILEKLGYEYEAYQENKRISFLLDDVEIEIDTWPMLKPHLEIEADSKEKIRKVVELLGYKMEDTCSKSALTLYKEIGIDLSTIKELKF